MYVFDLSNPFTLILMLVITVLLIFLGKEIKKPYVPAIALGAFLLLVVLYAVQLAFVPEADGDVYRKLIMKCIGIDFVFIFISFISYLWIDDISANFYKKKSVDNSLDWFWNKV